MKIGDVVKSLDFNGVDNCYMVGTVVGVFRSTGTFRAKFIKRVWEGEVDKKCKTDYCTAPLQSRKFLDRDGSPRVIVIA